METKEKADTAYAIAEVTQEEWNRIQGLKPARPTRILEVRKLEDTIIPLSYLYRTEPQKQDGTEMNPEHHVRQLPGLREKW